MSVIVPPIETPFFGQNPEYKAIVVGSGAAWALPAIDEGLESLKEIKVEPHVDLSPFLTFDSKSLAFIFKKDEDSKSLAGRFLPIKITLVGVNGNQSEYTMYMIFYDADDKILEET